MFAFLSWEQITYTRFIVIVAFTNIIFSRYSEVFPVQRVTESTVFCLLVCFHGLKEFIFVVVRNFTFFEIPIHLVSLILDFFLLFFSMGAKHSYTRYGHLCFNECYTLEILIQRVSWIHWLFVSIGAKHSYTHYDYGLNEFHIFRDCYTAR